MATNAEEWTAHAAENERLAAGHRHLADEAAALDMPEEAKRQAQRAGQRIADAEHCRGVAAKCAAGEILGGAS